MSYAPLKMLQHDPIMKRALGIEFERLHPMLRRQYSITSVSGEVGKGAGMMTEVTHGPAYMLPFLRLGARRLLLFPETGKEVAFTVENYAYVDALGRETITWTRTFEYLIFNERRRTLIVYAGSHQHLAVELKASVDSSGSLCLETACQRLYEFAVGIPIPILLSGVAKVRESFSEERDRFEIDVTIDNWLFGHIFGYKGWFHHEVLPCEAVPSYVYPKRTEQRD